MGCPFQVFTDMDPKELEAVDSLHRCPMDVDRVVCPL